MHRRGSTAAGKLCTVLKGRPSPVVEESPDVAPPLGVDAEEVPRPLHLVHHHIPQRVLGVGPRLARGPSPSGIGGRRGGGGGSGERRRAFEVLSLAAQAGGLEASLLNAQ